MKELKGRLTFKGVLLSVLFAGECFFVLDMSFTWAGSHLPAAYAIAVFIICLAAALSVSLRRARLLMWTAAGLCLLIAASALLAGGLLYHLYSATDYEDTVQSKADGFDGRTVMVFTPHQDDELNILGGVLERFVRGGSKVYVVYLTNGDYSISAEQRLAEAAASMASCGIPEEQLIFLGYGDGLTSAAGTPAYLCGENETLLSAAGHDATYASDSHPPFKAGRSYTLHNMYEDVRDVIIEYRPDLAFCVDFDRHADHRLMSMLFDEAMGEVLRTVPGYEPLVYKAFAYSTAYYSPLDFYSTNLLSTVHSADAGYMTETNVYNWDERVRLPIDPSGFSRSVFACPVYAALKADASQPAALFAGSIINGDKVFWQRETGSLGCSAVFTASSGSVSALNDFVLAAAPGTGGANVPNGNLWLPDAGDRDAELSIRLAAPEKLCRIVLYDNLSFENNVLDALISFDDGTQIHTGPLDKNGSGTELCFEPRMTGSLKIKLLSTEGSSPGLSEVELFDRERDCGFSLIKLMDDNGDFVYDYYIDPSGRQSFRLYALGCSGMLEDYSVSCDGGSGCAAEADGERLTVVCPRGETCTVTVSSPDGRLTDSVFIRNERTGLLALCQHLEEGLRNEFLPDACHSNTWLLCRSIFHFVCRT